MSRGNGEDNSGDTGSQQNGGVGYNASQMITYTWNDNSSDTYNWVSDLAPPTDEWSFVAVTIQPDMAVVYLANTNSGLQSATNNILQMLQSFGNGWQIGNDDCCGTPPVRTYNGSIDEVAIFPYTLSYAQVKQMYETALTGVLPTTQPTLTVGKSGTNVVITWSGGTLQSATVLTGPWANVPGNPTSPYTTAVTGRQQFFRAVVAP
jgi:hypothetical protein